MTVKFTKMEMLSGCAGDDSEQEAQVDGSMVATIHKVMGYDRFLNSLVSSYDVTFYCYEDQGRDREFAVTAGNARATGQAAKRYVRQVVADQLKANPTFFG